MLGREYTTYCKCSNYKKSYYITENQGKLYFTKRKNSLYFQMILCINGEYTDTYIFDFNEKGTEISNNLFEKFDENNPPEDYYRTYFTSKEEAQKYADYLNKLEEEKSE